MVLGRDIMQTILSWVYYKHYKEGETNRNRNIREKCKQFTTKITANYVLDSSLTPFNTLEIQKRFIGPYKSLGEVLHLQKKLCEPVRVLVKNGVYGVEGYDIANLHIIGLEGLVLFTIGCGTMGMAIQNEVEIQGIALLAEMVIITKHKYILVVSCVHARNTLGITISTRKSVSSTHVV